MVKFIKKREGKIDRFDSYRIRNAISKAVRSVYLENDENITDILTSNVLDKINQQFLDSDYLTIQDIESIIIDSSTKIGYGNVAKAYQSYRDKRAEVRKVLSIATNLSEKNTTDAALLIESDSKDSLGTWDRARIVKQLEDEADLSSELATDIAKIVENIVIDMYQRGVRKLNTTDIRSIVDLVLRQNGLEIQRKKQAVIGIPSSDLDDIILKKSHENSNIASNNPEAVNLEIAERIQKQYALEKIFSDEVAQAHLRGAIHLHDLGYPTRVYCSSHSLEYIKKFGLGKLLANLESKSNPPNSAAVLNQHVQTFLASMQANYAGALGFGFLNILYAPLINRPVEIVKIKIGEKELELEKSDLQKFVEQNSITNFEIISMKKALKEISEKEMEQVAQNLIFASSQNAFSRGGQTLFIDFNIHLNVPHYLKNVPAVGPKGKYMIQHENGEVELVDSVPRYNNPFDKNDPKNGDADSSQLKEGKTLTYGDFEKTSQRFSRALLTVWRKGDKNGRPFHFPKCDLHIDKEVFENKEQLELFDYACQISAENGSVYFMFDRGNGAVLAQCCRLKEKITDSFMLKYPEKLRFCGFQNVTINLAQAAFKGKNFERCLEEIDKSMELAIKAHKQKASFIQQLLDSDGSPMRNLGRNSDDGFPYIDLKKATYIIGVIGLNEAVQILSGKQLHESEESYRIGLQVIAHMYKKISEYRIREGIKLTIEETPAESTTRRFAKLDLQNFKESAGIIKGTKEDPYYTNSIHFSPDAEVGLIDRIVGQSKFHEMIESGAIIHAYIGEKRPNKDAINYLVKKTLFDTRCSQLVFSPTYTECDACGNVMVGDKELCTNNFCKNSSIETLDKRMLFAVTRIVGYYSRIAHWNNSQVEIYKARKKAEEFYAGREGKDLSWLYKPNGISKLTLMQFGKIDCPNCVKLKETTIKQIDDMKLHDKVEFKAVYLEKADEKELADAAMYNVPMDSVPTLVIAGKNGFWKKTTSYAREKKKDGEEACSNGACSINLGDKDDFITPKEVEAEILARIGEWELKEVEIKKEN
jgi:ribonucleoside-triphosphate reductase